MPAKNSRKIYVPDGFYHVYNRGVEKRKIFLDDQDYKVFLGYLKLYLLSKDYLTKIIKSQHNLSDEEKNIKISKIAALNNFYEKIELLCFELMPNHFHFQLRQKEKDSMKLFIHSLNTKYVHYFNKKYNRIGPLFEGRYKAVLIEKESYLLHLSRYIHLNAKELLKNDQPLASYPWSSYPAYVNNLNVSWLKKDYIHNNFKKLQGLSFGSYQGFVEGYKEETDKEIEIYKNLLLD